MSSEKKITQSEWHCCIEVLSRVIEDTDTALDLPEIERLAVALSKQARKRLRREAALNISEDERNTRREQSQEMRRDNRLHDQQLIADTAIARVHQGKSIDQPLENLSTDYNEVHGRSKSCYCCGADYRQLHYFYHQLCPACAEINLAKRQQRVDLTGRYCLVTGGRIKIGYQTALKLLRDNATVMITTRFAPDALQRFSSEPDFNDWQARLFIQPLDFRDLPSLLNFINYLEVSWPWLDILINNAAQTVWRPTEFYTNELKQQDQQYLNGLISGESSNELLDKLTPMVDRHGQPIDRREQNSWTLRLHEVETRELLEVLLINTAAPCLLTAKLKPLLTKSKFPERFIINVTGLDGQFDRYTKTIHHPHVNMSKAALNMMTRTSAADYQQDGIYMNSVDTGWITHEGGYTKREQMRERGFIPPLDEVDGAARIYDPIVSGIKTAPVAGILFRNYLSINW